MWCTLWSPGVSRDPADLVSMVTIFLRRKHTCYLSVPLGIMLFSELSVSVCFSHQVFHRLAVAWSITAVVHCTVFLPQLCFSEIYYSCLYSICWMQMLSSSCLFEFCAVLSPDASNNSEVHACLCYPECVLLWLTVMIQALISVWRRCHTQPDTFHCETEQSRILC